ncbi:MAG: tetratricopeptide repeat protein, partial [Pseudonocardiaceae bacterium]
METDARGAQGVQAGEGNLQINVYAEAQSVVWPHQVGSVPLLADCYQHRERETAGLDEALTAGTVVLTQVLSGLGGVGKTQLAAGYARRLWAQHGVELLVWVTASSRPAVQATYAQAAAEIGHLPSQDVERAAAWFLGWLQTTSRSWLVVLDDVADPADLRGLWPTGPCGRTVVTTRCRDAVLTDCDRRLIDIGLYTTNEAVAYLQNKLGAVGTHVMAEAAELAADLGYLPLALAQAATFIRDRDETCAGYRRRLGDRRRRLWEILPEDALADDYRATVAATWSISVERADKLVPVGLARPVLQLLSTLDPNGVPLGIVTSPAALTAIAGQRSSSALDRDAGVDEQDCRDSLRNLHRLNLISLDPAGGARAIRTHSLVQRATLERLSTDAVLITVRAAADALVQVWPNIERDTELGRVLRDCAANLRKRHGGLLWESDGHGVLFRAGRSLGQCGLVRAAVGYWTEMVTEASATLGANHSDTLTARQNLAWWWGEAGDPAGAAAALEQVLRDRQRMLGPDHPDTLLTRNNLARWQGEAGDPAGALAGLEGLLSDYLRVLGPDHPDTLDARHT